ncbi:MAG: 3' terminal RNA ribose 2'-O-methyltransferase Hen1 [Clostridia bacterium]|nr:3' terminal RNA ribose 2'-O-methyltransferase Hen1 [Clostridia bacterium]
MLLTITYTGKNTQDLGYLLHKNPYRAQSFDLSFGNAYVFYPKVSNEETTAALLLDLNPIDLARGKLGSTEGGLFDYVNDRPYVASSFLSTALVRVFGTAMNGKCDKKPELVDQPLDLTACVHMLPCRGNEEMPKEVFEPLGYTVETRQTELDEVFPEWGGSAYIDLTLHGNVTVAALLNHLYVLIPVFDRQKHYFVSEEEIEKLLKHGEGWLNAHPARNKIVSRYFHMKRSYAHKAIDRLIESEPVDDADVGDEETEKAEAQVPDEVREKRISLNTRRLDAVKNAVLESGASSVIDLGCGECKLTAMLLEENQIKRVGAADVAVHVLEKAKQTLRYDRMPPYKKNKLTLMQASLTYKDPRFSGYDAACVVEVVEHLDPQRIPAFERVLFEFATPNTVVLTTPNKEYNAHYEWLAEDTLRHHDHRFEWTREEFKAWAAQICERFGYIVEISEIGDVDEACGAPTQMGVFRKCV